MFFISSCCVRPMMPCTFPFYLKQISPVGHDNAYTASGFTRVSVLTPQDSVSALVGLISEIVSSISYFSAVFFLHFHVCYNEIINGCVNISWMAVLLLDLAGC